MYQLYSVETFQMGDKLTLISKYEDFELLKGRCMDLVNGAGEGVSHFAIYWLEYGNMTEVFSIRIRKDERTGFIFRPTETPR